MIQVYIQNCSLSHEMMPEKVKAKNVWRAFEINVGLTTSIVTSFESSALVCVEFELIYHAPDAATHFHDILAFLKFVLFVDHVVTSGAFLLKDLAIGVLNFDTCNIISVVKSNALDLWKFVGVPGLVDVHSPCSFKRSIIHTPNLHRIHMRLPWTSRLPFRVGSLRFG